MATLSQRTRDAPTKNMTLEELQPTAAVRGILPDQVVTVVSVQWFGSEALELTYKGPSGRVANELLYRHDDNGSPAMLTAARHNFITGVGRKFWSRTWSGLDLSIGKVID